MVTGDVVMNILFITYSPFSYPFQSFSQLLSNHKALGAPSSLCNARKHDGSQARRDETAISMPFLCLAFHPSSCGSTATQFIWHLCATSIYGQHRMLLPEETDKRNQVGVKAQRMEKVCMPKKSLLRHADMRCYSKVIQSLERSLEFFRR